MSLTEEAQEFFLARQPILDRNEKIVAYELLFRSGGAVNHAEVFDDVQATSTVIVHAFSGMGLGAILGSARGFLNFSAEMLMSDVVELLPKDKVVVELLETIEITPDIVKRCEELKRKGFMLALDDFVELRPEYEPIMPLISVVKMELPALSRQEMRDAVGILKKWPVQMLAEKIDNPDQAKECMEMGYDLFQGYYFAKPAILSGKQAGTSEITMMQLLSAVLAGAEVAELEAILKHDPGLTHSLLQLVNSAAVGLRYKISSLKQGVLVLGRQQLQRWLELMLYVNKGGGTASPQLILASTRGRFMESLAEIMSKQGHRITKDFEDRAFLVGVMSLLHAVVAMPMEEIVERLNLDEDIRDALLTRKGVLGNTLALTERIEMDDFQGVRELVRQLPGIEIADLGPAQMEAMGWANAVSSGVGAAG